MIELEDTVLQASSTSSDRAGAGGDGPLRLSELFRLAIAFGLFTGGLEVAMRVAQRLLGGRTWLSHDVWWMAPLADCILFAALALLVASIRRFWKPARRLPAVCGVFAFVAFLGPLLAVERIHEVAAVVLAAGVATQVGRLSGKHPRLAPRVTAVSIPAAIVLLLLAVAVVQGGSRLREGRRENALPEPPAGAPNVLLLILDTVRAEDLSLYGFQHPTTPHLEALAARGVTFEHAISPSPWTLPAHASLFTGRHPHQLSADWERPLDAEDPTIAELLSSRGWATAGFVGNLIYATYETGLDRGFIRYEDYPTSPAMVARSSLLVRMIVNRVRRWLGFDQVLVWKSAESITSSFLDWSRARADRPFFAFLNYMDAHAPYIPPPELSGRFGPARVGWAPADLSNRRDWEADELRMERAEYDATIAFVDQQIGVLLDSLYTRGVLENTLVMVAGDHGEQFGEHGLVDHGNSLYRQLLEVPLVIAFGDRLPAGRRVREPVTLRDVPATMLDLLDSPDPLPGNSLLALVGSSASDDDPAGEIAWESPPVSIVSAGVRMPDWLPISRGDMQSIVLGGYHYIRNGDGVEELYAFFEDPREENDLADEERAGPVLERARAALHEVLSEY
jgi:arylsulfatase A-like enzyme